ncbi:MAG: hypothetical protein ABI898_10570 [Sphingomonadales bacterium]
MTDPSRTPETPAEKAEAQAIRKRWVTLGEIVAVAGVIIAALTLWNSFYERRDAEQVRQDERRAAQENAAAERRRIGLVATDAGGDTLTFRGVECALQSTDITFPTALGIAPQLTVTVHEIQADWFAKPLLKLTDGGPDRRDGRIPVLIESRCIGESGARTETAIYDIVYRIEPRILLGRSVKVRGMVLREAAGANARARLDALWGKRP